MDVYKAITILNIVAMAVLLTLHGLTQTDTKIGKILRRKDII